MDFDLNLFPKWLYPGSLAIPSGGTPRQVTKLLCMMAPILDDEDKTLYFGRLGNADATEQP